MEQRKPDISALSALCGRESAKFSRFKDLLLSYNARFNLTAITEEKEIFVKHFLDSVAGEGFFPKGACVAEVGSGAGFPSVPLMIVRPDLRFTLIESTGKKCEFLKVAQKELGLNARVVCGRAEELGRLATYRERYDVCCARAVARLNTLAEYCMPLVRVGGMFIAWKGGMSETEEAKKAISVLGGRADEVEYSLPDGMGERTLVLVKKTAPTPQKYPRGRGAERRDPIL